MCRAPRALFRGAYVYHEEDVEMSNYVMVKVGETEHRMRIRAASVKHLDEMLKGRPYMDALLEINERPVPNVVPFLWAANQPAPDSDQSFTEADAQGMYDELVDAGYTPTEFVGLVADLCTGSGFFVKGLADKLKALAQNLSQLTAEAGAPRLGKK